MRGLFGTIKLLLTTLAALWIGLTNTAMADNVSVKKTLSALATEQCTERKNIKRIQCLENALNVISSHLGTQPFSDCIPLHGKAPRSKRKPFKKAMKDWFPSYKTMDFIQPKLNWADPRKPLGVSKMESCFLKKLEMKARPVLDAPLPSRCNPKSNSIKLPKNIQTIGTASTRLLSVLASSTGRGDDIRYPYQWKAQDKSIACRPQTLAKGMGSPWDCENARRHQKAPRLKQTTSMVVIPDQSSVNKIRSLLFKTELALKDLSIAQESCQETVDSRLGGLSDIKSLLGPAKKGSPLEALQIDIAATRENWLNKKSFIEQKRALEKNKKILERAKKNTERIQQADMSRQKRVATDLARICYGQSIGIWGLTVQYGSELDFQMSRKARAMGPKMRHMVRMRHACKQAKSALEKVGGNVHLIRMPGDLFPKNLDAARLHKRMKSLTTNIKNAGIKEEASICFREIKKKGALKRQEIQDQLDSCEAVLSYFEKSGQKTLPHNNKTRADAQQRLMIIGKLAHKQSVAQSAAANAQECLRMWNDLIYKYNSVSKVQWTQCCKKRIPKRGLKDNKSRGRLLRQCAR